MKIRENTDHHKFRIVQSPDYTLKNFPATTDDMERCSVPPWDATEGKLSAHEDKMSAETVMRCTAVDRV